MFQKTTRSGWRNCSPGEFIRLRLFALEVHDLVLAKLVRNSPVDLEDAKFLARTGRLNETVLKQRYEKELRPYLGVDPNFETTSSPIEFSEGGLVCRNGGLPGNL